MPGWVDKLFGKTKEKQNFHQLLKSGGGNPSSISKKKNDKGQECFCATFSDFTSYQRASTVLEEKRIEYQPKRQGEKHAIMVIDEPDNRAKITQTGLVR